MLKALFIFQWLMFLKGQGTSQVSGGKDVLHVELLQPRPHREPQDWGWFRTRAVCVPSRGWSLAAQHAVPWLPPHPATSSS